MAVNLASLGNTIYTAVKDDPSACAAIRTEFSTLALQIATDPTTSSRITSATVNGQTFSAQPSMTNAQRLALLRWVVGAINAGSPISSTQFSTF